MKANLTHTIIVDVAEKLFQQFGFEKTSISDIAREAHKAKRSIYNHFNNKEEILIAVVNKELDTINNTLQAKFNNQKAHPLDILKEYLIKRATLMEKASVYHQIMQNFTDVIPNQHLELYQKINRFNQWEYNLFVNLTERCHAEQNKADFEPVAFANMLKMLLKSLDYSFFIHKKYAEYKGTYIFLINMIINKIKPNN